MNARKRKQGNTCPSKRQEKEEKVDTIFLDLKAKHQYDNPKLRLWARMITGGLHDSYDVPPAVPVFQGGPESKRKRETLAGALTGAVETIAKNVEKRTPEVPSAGSSQVINEPVLQMGISPGKSADLRMRNLEQLHYLQGLYEDKILSDQELAEQKRIVLDALRKLS